MSSPIRCRVGAAVTGLLNVYICTHRSILSDKHILSAEQSPKSSWGFCTLSQGSSFTQHKRSRVCRAGYELRTVAGKRRRNFSTGSANKPKVRQQNCRPRLEKNESTATLQAISDQLRSWKIVCTLKSGRNAIKMLSVDRFAVSATLEVEKCSLSCLWRLSFFARVMMRPTTKTALNCPKGAKGSVNGCTHTHR